MGSTWGIFRISCPPDTYLNVRLHTGAMHGNAAEFVPLGLTAHLREAYGLPIATIDRVPKGEDADAYRAITIDGTPYFVRVQRGGPEVQMDVALAATAVLHAQCGLTAVVAPLPTTRGAFTSRLATSTVAVFPFIRGTSAYDHELGNADWQRLATIVAAVHDSGASCRLPALPREAYDNPFAATIRNALQRADSAGVRWSPVQHQMAALLQAERADLEATMQQFARLGDQARLLAVDMVPTHGDPNLANVLQSDAGSLHLIDWGELAFGPRERDLMFFTGDRFAAFTQTYLAQTRSPRLHLDLFAFYLYRWALQEIADYTTRLLLETNDVDTRTHAWQEVQPYLPVPHAAIAAEVEAVRQALTPFARDGRLDLRTGPLLP